MGMERVIRCARHLFPVNPPKLAGCSSWFIAVIALDIFTECQKLTRHMVNINTITMQPLLLTASVSGFEKIVVGM
jgi:hypothetical protein